ncbi:MAG: hypothetical protein AB7S86_09125 [Hydrogenophaga sp.]|uniref:hypothetical protein n=1 Tax=Hydrogenophaga sp. TaxID=1904254 RepID=UPI003D14C697
MDNSRFREYTVKMHSDIDVFSQGADFGDFPAYEAPILVLDNSWMHEGCGTGVDPVIEAYSTPLPTDAEAMALRMGLDAARRAMDEASEPYSLHLLEKWGDDYDARLDPASPHYFNRFATAADEDEDYSDIDDDDKVHAPQSQAVDPAWKRAATVSRQLAASLGYKGFRGENGWLHPTPDELASMPPGYRGRYYTSYATFLTLG